MNGAEFKYMVAYHDLKECPKWCPPAVVGSEDSLSTHTISIGSPGATNWDKESKGLEQKKAIGKQKG